MASLDEIMQVRLAKMAELEKAGMNPFTAVSNETHTLAHARMDFDVLVNNGTTITIAGRIMSLRGQGAILFGTLFDGTESFQIVLKRDTMDIDVFALFTETIDMGDFIECTGGMFTTQKGEPSMQVHTWRILTKSLAPLPDKWAGIEDEDLRYRKRYLDILSDKNLQGLFKRKAKFWKHTRDFLEKHDFMEVHTPTLETTTGGAEAEPFATHHNDFDIPVYMRISVGELWQKRLMAAGFPRTYEIGRAYRNEGTSPNHLQEFTNMEFYCAYWDYRDGMKFTHDMYQYIIQNTYGKLVIEREHDVLDFNGEWPIIDYSTEIKNKTGIDIFETTTDELTARLKELHVVYDAKTKERLIDNLWKYCRKQITGPAFVIGYPDFMQPLAKRSETDPRIVEQFQILIAGSEIGKGYSELNDPIDQMNRFNHQQDLREEGDKDAMMPDWDFVDMLRHGMPPTCGFGFGERLFAVLEGKPIRETTLFPLMRPKFDEIN